MTYYARVTPQWPHSKNSYELMVEAASHRAAIDVARSTPGVALVTDMRDESFRGHPSFAVVERDFR